MSYIFVDSLYLDVEDSTCSFALISLSYYQICKRSPDTTCGINPAFDIVASTTFQLERSVLWLQKQGKGRLWKSRSLFIFLLCSFCDWRYTSRISKSRKNTAVSMGRNWTFVLAHFLLYLFIFHYNTPWKFLHIQIFLFPLSFNIIKNHLFYDFM